MDFKQSRNLAGITQQDLSKQIRVSQSAISQIEKGLTFPRQETREKIEAILGSVDWLSTRLSGMEMTGFKRHLESRPENGTEESIMAHIADFVKSGAMPSQWPDRFQFLRDFLDLYEKTLIENQAKKEAKYQQTAK